MRKIEELTLRNAELERFAINSQTQIDSLCSQQDNHEIEISTIQRAAFRQLAEVTWMPEEDSMLSGEFKHCNDRIWAWAKANALKSMDDVSNLDDAAQQELETYLARRKFVHLEDNKFPESFGKGKFSTHGPSLLLAAAISHELCEQTINDPFAVLYNTFDIGIENPPLASEGYAWEVLDQLLLKLKTSKCSTLKSEASD